MFYKNPKKSRPVLEGRKYKPFRGEPLPEDQEPDEAGPTPLRFEMGSRGPYLSRTPRAVRDVDFGASRSLIAPPTREAFTAASSRPEEYPAMVKALSERKHFIARARLFRKLKSVIVGMNKPFPRLSGASRALLEDVVDEKIAQMLLLAIIGMHTRNKRAVTISQADVNDFMARIMKYF